MFAPDGLRLHARGRGLPHRAAGVARRAPAQVPGRVERRGPPDRGHRRQPRLRRPPALDGAPQGVAADPERGPLGRHQLARRVGRPGRHGDAERHLLRGDGQGPHARHLQRQRPVADRADDHPLGHRRAEGHAGSRTSSTPTTTGARGSASPRPAATSPTSAPLAVLDGDDYVLNGQKIWISTAHIAKWGLFLVRTDPDAIAEGRKHEGITALIVDMEADGIECRPIRDITGEEMFNEVFFTDAHVQADYRLGGEGEGWQVAMGTLGHERVGTAGLAITMKADLDAMVNLARAENPDALRGPRPPGAHRPGPHPDRVHPAPQLPGAVQDPEGREELARGPAGQAAVEPPGPDPGRAGRRPARPRRDARARAGPTPSTAARGTGCTCSSATRRSAPAPPRSRRTSSPTAPSGCPRSRAARTPPWPGSRAAATTPKPRIRPAGSTPSSRGWSSAQAARRATAGRVRLAISAGTTATRTASPRAAGTTNAIATHGVTAVASTPR